MKKSILVLLIIIFCFILAYPAFEDIPNTGLTRGLGGSVSARIDGVESVFYNPAGMFTTNRISATLAYSQPYGISDLSRSILGLNYKMGRYNLGLGINQLSLHNIYNEQKITLAMSMRITRWYIGLGVNSYSISLPGWESVSGSTISLTENVNGVTVTAGSVFRVTRDLNIALTLFDLGGFTFSHSGLETEDAETSLKEQISVAALYNFKDYVYSSIEFRNEPESLDDWEESLRLGFELVFYQAFAVRLGNYSGDTTYGFGINHENFNVDFAYIANSELGNNYIYSINLKF